MRESRLLVYWPRLTLKSAKEGLEKPPRQRRLTPKRASFSQRNWTIQRLLILHKMRSLFIFLTALALPKLTKEIARKQKSSRKHGKLTEESGFLAQMFTS